MSLATAPVPSISHHSMLVLLLQIAVLLACATGLGRVASLLRLPAVVGELVAGVVLGPSLLGVAAPAFSHWLLPPDPEQTHLLSAVAQLGVLLLVGITGAHIDLGLMRRKKAAITWVSLGSVLMPLVLGVGLGFLLPGSLLGDAADRSSFALFVGIAVAVSALPVIAKTLLDMKLMHRDVGQVIIGAAAISDVLAWLLLSIVSTTAVAGFRAEVVFESVGYLLLVLAAAAFLARPLIGALMRPVARAGEEAGITAAVVLIVLAAVGTHALNMEPVVGAFLCGIVISSLGAGSRRHLQALRPFVMAVLAPLFLATAGLQVDIRALGKPITLAAAAATLGVAVAAKFAGSYVGARLGRLGHDQAVAIGAGLNARGVVEIVLASVGRQMGILNTASYTIIVLVAVVTSVMAPPILRLATRRMAVTEDECFRELEYSVQKVPS